MSGIPSRERRRVMAGNWKMHKTHSETRAFFAAFLPMIGDAAHCDVVIAPPFTSIAAAVEAAKGSRVAIAGQNNHWQMEGAFTGEVSSAMFHITRANFHDPSDCRLKTRSALPRKDFTSPFADSRKLLSK